MFTCLPASGHAGSTPCLSSGHHPRTAGSTFAAAGRLTHIYLVASCSSNSSRVSTTVKNTSCWRRNRDWSRWAVWAEMLHLQNLQRKRISLCGSLHFQTHTHRRASTLSQKQRSEPERERFSHKGTRSTFLWALPEDVNLQSQKYALMIPLLLCTGFWGQRPWLFHLRWLNPVHCLGAHKIGWLKKEKGARKIDT